MALSRDELKRRLLRAKGQVAVAEDDLQYAERKLEQYRSRAERLELLLLRDVTWTKGPTERD